MPLTSRPLTRWPGLVARPPTLPPRPLSLVRHQPHLPLGGKEAEDTFIILLGHDSLSYNTSLLFHWFVYFSFISSTTLSFISLMLALTAKTFILIKLRKVLRSLLWYRLLNQTSKWFFPNRLLPSLRVLTWPPVPHCFCSSGRSKYSWILMISTPDFLDWFSSLVTQYMVENIESDGLAVYLSLRWSQIIEKLLTIKQKFLHVFKNGLSKMSNQYI